MVEKANAFPKKRFFLEMFTRDISLEDCILDLIDNSLDSVLEIRKTDIARQVLTSKEPGQKKSVEPVHVQIDYSSKSFTIQDNCGGIPYEEGLNEVFRFGPSPDTAGKLGVYGVGLKRAIFKLGNQVTVESHAATDGFRMKVDLAKWAAEDEEAEDWTFPLEKLSGAAAGKRGTIVTVTELHEEVLARFRDPTLENSLASTIAQTYTVFLDSSTRVKLNGTQVEKKPLPFGASSEVEPGRDTYDEGGVKVDLLVTVPARAQWKQEVAGWYVLCNARVIVHADKSELTGWGITLPAFHSKYRGFVGLALFTSKHPLKLPWTTSKRGVNRESLVYQHARARMTGLARPVINFLNSMYPSELAEAPAEREVASRVIPKDFRSELGPSRSHAFVAKAQAVSIRTTKIQFEAEPRELNRVRRKLRKPSMSATAIGRYAFDHFLKTECPE
jgi:Histidine kinase-, DNA gyrase B-, and HSP90-like ATPase